MNYNQAVKEKTQYPFKKEQEDYIFYLFIVPQKQADFKAYCHEIRGFFEDLEDSDSIQYSSDQNFRLCYISYDEPNILYEYI